MAVILMIIKCFLIAFQTNKLFIFENLNPEDGTSGRRTRSGQPKYSSRERNAKHGLQQRLQVLISKS